MALCLKSLESIFKFGFLVVLRVCNVSCIQFGPVLFNGRERSQLHPTQHHEKDDIARISIKHDFDILIDEQHDGWRAG
jgi:hypothetical protein